MRQELIQPTPLQLVWPAEEYLPEYVHALEQGWSPDTIRSEAGREELARIARDQVTFLALQVDPEGNGPRVTPSIAVTSAQAISRIVAAYCVWLVVVAWRTAQPTPR